MTELSTIEHPDVSQSAAILEVVERAASNPNVDIEKLERLLAMKERMESQAAERAYNAAMSAVQAELPKVRRDAENEQTSSRYATYEALSEALTPVITRNGFACSFGTDKSPMGEEMIRITVRISHSAGHKEYAHCDLPIDMVGIKGNANKTKTHGTGSTFMYGRRYLKLLVFDVAVANEDNDGNLPTDLITEGQAATIRDRLVAGERSEAAFCQYLKIKSLEEMPLIVYGRAIQAIESAEKAGAKNNK